MVMVGAEDSSHTDGLMARLLAWSEDRQSFRAVLGLHSPDDPAL